MDCNCGEEHQWSLGNNSSSPFLPESSLGNNYSPPFLPESSLGNNSSPAHPLDLSLGNNYSPPFLPESSLGNNSSPAHPLDLSLGNNYSSPFLPESSLGNNSSPPFLPESSLVNNYSSPFLPESSLGNNYSSPFLPESSLGNNYSPPFLPESSLGNNYSSPFLPESSLVNNYSPAHPLDLSLVNNYSPAHPLDLSLVNNYSPPFLPESSLGNNYSPAHPLDLSLVNNYSPPFLPESSLVNNYSPAHPLDLSLVNNYSPPFLPESSLVNNYSPAHPLDLSLGNNYSPPFLQESSLGNNYSPAHPLDLSLVNNYSPPFLPESSLGNNYSPPFLPESSLVNNYSPAHPLDLSLVNNYSPPFLPEWSLVNIPSPARPPDLNLNNCSSSTPLTRPFRIPNYELIKKLGQGGYGAVYQARNVRSNHEFAVKVSLKGDWIKFLNEASIMSSLNHPNIIRMFDVHKTEEMMYMVMELAHGGDLRHFLNNRRILMTEEQVRPIIRQAASVFTYIHSKNVVHGDIKLENIMYDDLGALKVTDFGLSRVLTPGTLLFGKRGTPRYMAPEMYRDEGYNGAAADVWALGILLHAVIKGSFPFQWQMIKELASNNHLYKYDPPTSVGHQCAALLKSMLCIDPTKRISMKEILDHPWLNKESHGPRKRSHDFESVDVDETPSKRLRKHKEQTPKRSGQVGVPSNGLKIEMAENSRKGKRKQEHDESSNEEQSPDKNMKRQTRHGTLAAAEMCGELERWCDYLEKHEEDIKRKMAPTKRRKQQQ